MSHYEYQIKQLQSHLHIAVTLVLQKIAQTCTVWIRFKIVAHGVGNQNLYCSDPPNPAHFWFWPSESAMLKINDSEIVWLYATDTFTEVSQLWLFVPLCKIICWIDLEGSRKRQRMRTLQNTVFFASNETFFYFF